MNNRMNHRMNNRIEIGLLINLHLPIHNVNVQPISSTFKHFLTISLQIAKISGQD